MQLCYVGCTSFKVVENISKTFLFLFYKWKFVPMHIIMNCNRVTVAALFWNQHFQPLSGFENCDDGLRINSKQAWNFDSGSYDYCSIRDGKRFYLKWNNIFFQHHFRSKTIYFSFFPLRYCGSQNVLRSDSSYCSQMQGIVELSAKAIFSKKTLLYSAGSECEKE